MEGGLLMLTKEEKDVLLEIGDLYLNDNHRGNGKLDRILLEMEKLLSVKWYQWGKMNEAVRELNNLGVSLEEVKTLLKKKPLLRLKQLKQIFERVQQEELYESKRLKDVISRRSSEHVNYISGDANTLKDAISSRSSERYVGSSSPITCPPPSFGGRGFGRW